MNTKLKHWFRALVPCAAAGLLFGAAAADGSYAVDARLPGPEAASEAAAGVLSWDVEADGCRHGMEEAPDCPICSGSLPYMPLPEDSICISQEVSSEGQFVLDTPEVSKYALEAAYVYREQGQLLDASLGKWEADAGDVFTVEYFIQGEGEGSPAGWCFQAVELAAAAAAPAKAKAAPLNGVSPQADGEARLSISGAASEVLPLHDAWVKGMGSKKSFSVTLLKDVTADYGLGMGTKDKAEGITATLYLNGHTLVFTKKCVLSTWANREETKSSTNTLSVYGGSVTPRDTAVKVDGPGDPVTDVAGRKMVYYTRDWDGDTRAWYKHTVDFSGMGCIYGGASDRATDGWNTNALITHDFGDLVMQNVLVACPSETDGNKNPYEKGLARNGYANRLVLQSCGFLGFGWSGDTKDSPGGRGLLLAGPGVSSGRDPENSFSNVYVSGADSKNKGAGIAMYSGGKFHFADVVVSDCHTSGENGGGISVEGDSQAVFGGKCTVAGNSSGAHGGGICVNYQYKNDAGYPGGGGRVLVSGQLCVANNQAMNNGGGIYANSGDFRSWLSSPGVLDICSNTAGGNGGGIYVRNMGYNLADPIPDMEISGALIEGNTAGFDGGGVYAHSWGLYLVSSKVCNNVAKRNGGGIYVGSHALAKANFLATEGSVPGDADLELHLSALQVEGNSAQKGVGGGVYLGRDPYWEETDEFSLGWGTAVQSNRAAQGGGMWCVSRAKLRLNNAVFEKNMARMPEKPTEDTPELVAGGGMYLSPWCEVTSGFGAEFVGNAAEQGGYGGGLYNNRSDVSLQHVSFTDNSAHNSGGGIYQKAGSLTLTDSTVSGNTAKYSNGGGLYLQEIENTAQEGFESNAVPAVVEIRSSTFRGNRASGSPNGGKYANGGGVYVSDLCSLTLSEGIQYQVDDAGNFTAARYDKECVLEGNEANGLGGGVYLHDGGNLSLKSGAKVRSNHASNGGGGVYWEEGEFQAVEDKEAAGIVAWEKRGSFTVTGTGLELAGNTSGKGYGNLNLCDGRFLQAASFEWGDAAGFTSGTLYAGYDLESLPAGKEAVICKYNAGVDVSFLGLVGLFGSDREDQVTVASKRDLNYVVLGLKYDHVRHAGVDLLGHYTTEGQKGALKGLLSKASALAAGGTCRHGYGSTEDCGACSGMLPDLSGSTFPGCCRHGNYKGRDCKDCKDGVDAEVRVAAAEWDDAITVDKNGVADLFEGMFDNNAAVSPWRVFDASMDSVPITAGRYASLSIGEDYLLEYLVTDGDAAQGYILRPVHALDPVDFEVAEGEGGSGFQDLIADKKGKVLLGYPGYAEAVLPPGSPEAAYFLQDGDFYGTAAECLERLSQSGGCVSLLDDVSVPGFSMDAVDGPGGLYLNGHVLEVVSPITVPESGILGIGDGSRVYGGTALGGEGAPFWDG